MSSGLLVVVVANELVPAEAGVDESVDQRAGKVLPCRVERAAAPALHKVLLEDVLRGLGLCVCVSVNGTIDGKRTHSRTHASTDARTHARTHARTYLDHIQVPGDVEEMLGKFVVGNDLFKRLVGGRPLLPHALDDVGEVRAVACADGGVGDLALEEEGVRLASARREGILHSAKRTSVKEREREREREREKEKEKRRSSAGGGGYKKRKSQYVCVCVCACVHVCVLGTCPGRFKG